MSHLPDDDASQVYVSKSTFLHLWEKFKQTEQALAESERIKDNFARSVIDLGNQARESADQLKALREELARVQEDLHTANDMLAKVFKPRQ